MLMLVSSYCSCQHLRLQCAISVSTCICSTSVGAFSVSNIICKTCKIWLQSPPTAAVVASTAGEMHKWSVPCRQPAQDASKHCVTCCNMLSTCQSFLFWFCMLSAAMHRETSSSAVPLSKGKPEAGSRVPHACLARLHSQCLTWLAHRPLHCVTSATDSATSLTPSRTGLWAQSGVLSHRGSVKHLCQPLWSISSAL